MLSDLAAIFSAPQARVDTPAKELADKRHAVQPCWPVPISPFSEVGRELICRISSTTRQIVVDLIICV